MAPKQRKTQTQQQPHSSPKAPPPKAASPPAAAEPESPIIAAPRHKRRCCCSRVGISFLSTIFFVWLGFVFRHEMPSSQMTPIGVLVEEPSRPGMRFNHSEARCRRPVVFIPGFVSTALEVWENRPCASSSLSTDFRKRLFGASMLLTLLENPQCFFEHASLNPDNATDPPGIKLRPDSGFSSVDYIIPGFWVWAKVFRNLADVGYSPENLYVASYDWRLAPEQMATRRVGYFDRLKSQVEHLQQRSREVLLEHGETVNSIEEEGCDRIVFVTHSYGANVLTEFFAWADAKEPGWTDRYSHAFINVGGPLLGIPKATAALLSGEFRDTAMLPKPTRALVDTSLPRLTRAWAFRSWPSLWALSPIGGDAAWPNLTRLSFNGTLMGATRVHRELLSFVAGLSNNTLLSRNAATYDAHRVAQLPTAKRMHVLCIYGVSKPAETGYTYTMDAAKAENGADSDWGTLRIDPEGFNNGVELGDGDGTVPLHSLGYLCRTQLPAGMRSKVERVTIQEHPDQAPVGVAPPPSGEQDEILQKILHALDGIGLPDPRGGASTGDHVDIMGNHLAIETILKVAMGPRNVAVLEQVVSNIDEVTRQLDETFGRFVKG